MFSYICWKNSHRPERRNILQNNFENFISELWNS